MRTDGGRQLWGVIIESRLIYSYHAHFGDTFGEHLVHWSRLPPDFDSAN